MRASLLRKRGPSVGFPCFRTLRHRHSQARRRRDRRRFPRSWRSGFYRKRGSAAPSWQIWYMYCWLLLTTIILHWPTLRTLRTLQILRTLPTIQTWLILMILWWLVGHF